MKPWRRSWRATGSFRMLSIGARGLFREMMTELADDDGVIDCGHRSPHEAVCFALGATRSDRQMVLKWLVELLKDGCVVSDGTVLRLPNWHAYQADQATPRSVKAAKKRQTSDRQATDIEQPSDVHPTDIRPTFDAVEQPSDVHSQPSDNLLPPKCAESLTRACQKRGEERRREESRREHATHAAGAREEVTPARLWRQLDDAWFEVTGDRLPGLMTSKARGDLELLLSRHGADAVAEDMLAFIAHAGTQQPPPHSPWALYVSKAGAWARVAEARSTAARESRPVTGILDADETERMMARKMRGGH